jgi:hypothetical protein
MGDIVKIKAFKRARAESKVLCTSGFHKWQVQTAQRFDVKAGKLVSSERCQRCGAIRNKLA